MLARDAIEVRPIPRVERDPLLLEIGAIPGGQAWWLLDQGLQPLLLRWVARYVELEEVERAGQIFDLDMRSIGLGAAEIFEYLRRHERDNQPEDD